MSTQPANDVTLTIARGTTCESTTWRARRAGDHFEVTSLVNAGKRGKACAVFTVLAPPCASEDHMEAIAPAIRFAVENDATVEVMRAMLVDVTLAGLRFTAGEKRGVDVPRGPAIEAEGPLMHGTFTETEALVSFSFYLNGKSGMTQDTLLMTSKRADAAKAFAWARANRDRLPTMTLTEFRTAMAAIGARFS